MKTQITTTEQPAMMSSREIAKLTDKRPADVIRDIWVMLESLHIISKDDANVRHHKNQQVTINNGVISSFDSRGYVSEFLLDRRHTEILITGYDVMRRAAVIDRWFKLETERARPKSQAELIAAMALANVEQERRLNNGTDSFYSKQNFNLQILSVRDYAFPAPAKSGVGRRNPDRIRAHNRASGFFMRRAQPHSKIMVGRAGQLSSWPVSLIPGIPTPVRLTTHECRNSGGGVSNPESEDAIMATTPTQTRPNSDWLDLIDAAVNAQIYLKQLKSVISLLDECAGQSDAELSWQAGALLTLAHLACEELEPAVNAQVVKPCQGGN